MTQKYQVKVSMKQAAIVETGIVLKQGDFGMQIEIEVLDFDATGTTPQIVFRKAMGAVESTTITVSSNKYTYTFKGTELDTPGKVFCDLKLKNSTTQRISTASFMFKVVADTLDGLNEQASSYSDTIQQLFSKAITTKEVNLSYGNLNQFNIMGYYNLPTTKTYSNDPIGTNKNRILIVNADTSGNVVGQIIADTETGDIYFRSYANSTWSPWASNKDNINGISKSLFVDYGTVTEGYLDEDGTLIAATTNKEITSDYIEITNTNYIWTYVSRVSHSLWARAVFYDENKTVLYADYIQTSTTGVFKTGSFAVLGKAKYMRVSFRRMSDLTAYLYVSGAYVPDFESILNQQLVMNKIPGYEEGYLTDTGEMHATTNYNEVTSDYIPVKYGREYSWRYTTTTSTSLFARACLYDSNKTFVKVLQILPTTTTNEATGHMIIDNSDVAYIRISYRRGGSKTNQFYFSTDGLAIALAPITEEFLNLSRLQIKTFSGYIAAVSNNIAQFSAADSTTQELTTDRIACKSGDTFKFKLIYPSSQAAWAVCGVYDSSDFLIRRVTLLNSTITTGEASYTILQADTTAAYIRFSWRSYGNATVSIYSDSRIQSAFQMAADADKQNEFLVNKGLQIVKGINHQGYNSIAPNNTLPAFVLSKKMGFEYVETDVQFTSDNVPVLLHNSTINDTARNADGTQISETISINDITYEQALTYDFGIWKGSKFAGTKIPTLDEFIKLCKYIGLNAYVEIKPETLTQTQVENMFSVIEKYRMQEHVTWISSVLGTLQEAVERFPNGRFGLIVGTAGESTVTTAASLKSNTNEIFIDAYSIDSEVIDLCKENNIDVEVWTKDYQSGIVGIDPYVTGVTSNSYNAGYVLFSYETHQFEGIV